MKPHSEVWSRALVLLSRRRRGTSRALTPSGLTLEGAGSTPAFAPGGAVMFRVRDMTGELPYERELGGEG